MRSLPFALLLASAPSLAWEFTESEPIEMPGDVQGLVAAPMGPRDVVVAMGDDTSWIVDVAHGEVVRSLDRGGRAAVLLDVDGDARDDLVGCGASGLWSVPWAGRYGGEATTYDLRECTEVVVVRANGLSYVVAAGPGWISAFDPSAQGLVRSPEQSIPALEGTPLLAAHNDLVGYAVVGGDTVYEHGPIGMSTFATGGPIGDLAWARRSWTWSLPDTYTVADHTNRQTPVPDVKWLLPSVDQLLVVGDGVSTWLTGDEVEAHATPAGVRHVALAELNGDYCADVIVSDGRAIRGLTGSCTDAVTTLPPAQDTTPQTTQDGPAPGPRLRTPRVQRRRMVMGVEVPSFLGREQVTPLERSRRQQHVVVGSGWAMGATLGPTEVQIPFFPALALGYEFGGPHARFFAGLDSAALFFWILPDGEGGGIHLANATFGATFGSPTLRAGPFITGGLLNYGAGLRAALTPWTAGGSSKGIEARLTVFGPATGEVMILYVWSQPVRGRKAIRNELDPPEPEDETEYPELTRVQARAEPKRPTRAAMPVCGRFSVGAGAAVSLSSTVYSWTHVGANNTVAVGGSPAVALTCDSDFGPKRPLSLFIGMESAPFLRYLLYQGGATGTDRLSHFGTVSVGATVGGERFSIGPMGVAGIWELGGGARTVIGLHTDRQGLRHQIELRAWALYKGAPAGEAFLLYGFSFDPWKKPAFRED
ncbi:MAG: hypothetical protein EP330_02325 [Deltaproteobacteria bacterium]|nr:MAG: hypothetical protein EP330_02325 [Deltaproteobacteria bacterium]